MFFSLCLPRGTFEITLILPMWMESTWKPVVFSWNEICICAKLKFYDTINYFFFSVCFADRTLWIKNCPCESDQYLQTCLCFLKRNLHKHKVEVNDTIKDQTDSFFVLIFLVAVFSTLSAVFHVVFNCIWIYFDEYFFAFLCVFYFWRV